LNPIALSLFSGGLDSIIAVKTIAEQGIHVQGITFETPFFNAAKAQAAAALIGLPLMVINFTDDHLAMLKNPRYGYGKNMNPCIDCHTLMLRRTGMLMGEMGADFIFTGEVLGQRPMSQGKQSLYIVAQKSGYPDVILRPLSARLLPETKPEREGKVDRKRLLAIQGRGRKEQMALAIHYGIPDYAPPAGGCLLTDPMFAKRLRDLFHYQKDPPVRDIELLKYGRHFRLNHQTKIIVGRNATDNKAIQEWQQTGDALFEMAVMPGPTVLIPGGGDEESCKLAAGFCVLYSGTPKGTNASVVCLSNDQTESVMAKPLDRDIAASFII
jgi:tRNA-uridine 2-sulfurtransferase